MQRILFGPVVFDQISIKFRQTIQNLSELDIWEIISSSKIVIHFYVHGIFKKFPIQIFMPEFFVERSK